MTINRHNYEEFFLLYADDELNAQQRAEVELFVEQNPDMAVELEIIQQIKLLPENDLVYPDKASLFKTSDVEINIDNYGEFFLLYIDRELDEGTREKVEKFVLQHPQVQHEFTLLKQTVLQPEAISFGNKSRLYRQEERKVAYIPWLRISAAAAVIAIGLMFWWLSPGRPVVPVTLVVVNNSQKTTVKPNTTTDSLKPVVPAATQKNNSDVAGVNHIEKAKGLVKQAPKVNNNKVNNDVQVVQQPVNNNATGTNSTIASTTGTQPNKLQTDTAVTNGQVATRGDNAQPKGVQPNFIATITNKPIVVTESQTSNLTKLAVAKISDQDIAKPAVYKELDTDDEDRSMYVGALQLNKDKVKGFLKRASRIFGGRPKKDTD